MKASQAQAKTLAALDVEKSPLMEQVYEKIAEEARYGFRNTQLHKVFSMNLYSHEVRLGVTKALTDNGYKVTGNDETSLWTVSW